MNLTHEERIELQKTLDAVYAVECDAYEEAIARGVPEWLLKKPERFILYEATYQNRTFKRNTAGTRKAQERMNRS